MDEQTALTIVQPRQMGMITPLVDVQAAKQAVAAYEALKAALVRPEDIQVIQQRKFLRKSFWRRIASCFGLSLELVREERLEVDGALMGYRVVYRAIAPNGQSMDGDGMMVFGENGQRIEHNIRAIAHTRAKNRAISDLVGGGEVSAEELGDEDGIVDSQPRRAPQQAPQGRAPKAQAPQRSLADDMATLHTRCLQSGKVETQHDWDEHLAKALGPTYSGDERTLTRADFTELVNYFKDVPAKEHASLRELPTGSVA